MMRERTVSAFFALLKAGLWEARTFLSAYEPLDFDALYALAEKQTVVGIISAGLEQASDKKVRKSEALPFMKKVFSIENRNKELNRFIEDLLSKMRHAGIYPLLVKGQGIAQCYANPLWRSSGDIDFLLDSNAYERAKRLLKPIAQSVEEEIRPIKHQGLSIGPFSVELHGTLHGSISAKVNRVIDEVQSDCFSSGHVRVWRNGSTDVFLPSPDNDVIFVFTHLINHFFRGGVGLRQICDWSRLLWTYRESIDFELLERRTRQMHLMTEWKAFARFAVDYLGMPAVAMPLYDPAPRWKRKAERICSFILSVGNFGHNRDNSFYEKYPYLVYKTISLWRHTCDFFRHLLIFPINSTRVFMKTFLGGLQVVINKK